MGTQLLVGVAVVLLGAVLAFIGWLLRRVIVSEIDRLSRDLAKLHDDLSKWRDHYDRRLTRMEARMDIWEAVNPRRAARRRDDPPIEEKSA